MAVSPGKRSSGGNGADSRAKSGSGKKDSRYAKRLQSGGVKPRPEGSRTLFFFNRFGRWVAVVVVLVCLVLLVAPNMAGPRFHWQSGQTITEDVRALVSFSVTDEAALEREIEALKARLPHFYQYNPQAIVQSRNQIVALLKAAETLRAEEPAARPKELADKLIAWAESEQRARMTPEAVGGLFQRMTEVDLVKIIDEVLRHVYEKRGVVRELDFYRENYEAGRVQIKGIESLPRDLIDYAKLSEALEKQFEAGGDFEYVIAPRDRALMIQLAKTYIRPNIIYRSDETEENREKAVARLRSRPPEITQRRHEKGETIIAAGTILTRSELDLLRGMQTVYRDTLLRRLLAIGAYAVILSVLVFHYFRKFRDLPFTTSNVFLISLPVLMALAIGRMATEIARFPEAAGYAFPAGIIGMITVILLDARAATLMVTIGALAFGVHTGMDFKIFLTSLLGGYAAVAVLTTAKERKEVLRAGIVVGLVNAGVILVVNLIDDPTKIDARLVLWGLGGGLVCGIIAMPSLVLFENMFGVVTDIRLLELTGLDHPLLKELEEKAPGSYQHCLNVCKLAEAAAKTIGANYLLVRAGAYYHDIGKTLKPSYFGENQVSLSEKSMHSKISPYMSAMIIKNHVKAGVELARQYKLPEKVIDFIPQHHGTSTITYFYHEALKRFENSQSTDPVRESDFRYPGPRPQFIETAIIMLADTVEATVTSRFTSISVNEHELAMCVRKSITDKFNDGQFDECDLTLRDLYLIQQSFVKTLLGRFHQRVAYPTAPGLSGPSAPASKHDRMDRENPDISRSR
jgi:putative nucleotidyltransferase with HDIG domain